MKVWRPRLALPYTLVREPDRVRLLAGEDFRYTLSGAGIDAWLPDWLERCDGRRTVAELLAELLAERRDAAAALCERLYGERLLVDGPALQAHRPARYGLTPVGTGIVADGLAAAPPDLALPSIPVLCQDRLDYDEALRFNERCLPARATVPTPFFWVSCGAMTRGYVSPPFLPDAAPCLQCLVRHFQRLSPAPELYDVLIAHKKAGRPLPAVPFPPEAAAILLQLVRWKAGLLAEPEPPAALYLLHVLEISTMELTAHPVFPDPECPACQECGR